MTILIRNGTVVSPTGATPMDVLIDGETTAALYAPGAAAGITAGREIDATGKYVIPGGIDVHTHMEMPFGGTTSADTFETGTRAAAWGGTTTIIDFAIQRKGESLAQGLENWHARADGQCAIDWGFHAIMTDVNTETL